MTEETLESNASSFFRFYISSASEIYLYCIENFNHFENLNKPKNKLNRKTTINSCFHFSLKRVFFSFFRCHKDITIEKIKILNLNIIFDRVWLMW